MKEMLRTSLFPLCLLAALLLAGCESAGVATPCADHNHHCWLDGHARVLSDLTTEFNRQHPGVLFAIRGGGSTIGEELVRRREVDLGASTLFPPQQALDPTPANRRMRIRGRIADRIGQVGSCRSSQQQHQRAFTVQLRDIFAGRLLDWLALGSDAGEIQLVSREDGSGSRILFETRAMGEEHVALTAVVMPTSQDVVEYVAKNPSAIGYVSRAEVAELITEASSPQAAARHCPTSRRGDTSRGKTAGARARAQPGVCSYPASLPHYQWPADRQNSPVH